MLPLAQSQGVMPAFVDVGYQPRSRPMGFEAPRQVPLSSADVGRRSTCSASIVGAAILSAAAAGSRRTKRRVQRRATTSGPVVDRATTKQFRRDLMKSEQYFRFGRTQMEDAMNELKAISGDDLVSKLRQNGFQLTVGDVTFVLAESYGFCWGVERAVAMAYEARKFFPDKKIWVTNEIIHNPLVNKNLRDLDMEFIEMKDNGLKDFTVVEGGDVVILPAFGASVDEMALLQDKGAQIVDTTCPWVSKVWQSVEKSKDKGHTSIIHGKYDHEETVATKSFAQTYLIVKDMIEAEYVVNYVLEGGDRAEFMKKFENAMSEGFDPDVDLDKVGVANQTTMLKGETELIAKLFERTMIQKFGPQEINQHFVSFNTICDATQERQDAMYKMFGSQYEPPQSKVYAELEDEQVGIELLSEKGKNQLSSRAMEDATRGAATMEAEAPPTVDLCLIVGGYNSSNTAHLLEIALEEGVPAYHIDCADRISRGGEGQNTIEHKPLSTKPADAMLDQGLEITDPFLPSNKPLVIGVTSGASTPDKEVGECLQRIISLIDARSK